MTAPSVDRPIFLIGTGRCGSSLLLRLLGYHPDLAWQSHYTSWLPGGGRWAALSRVHDLPGLGWLLPAAERSRLVPQPTENYNLLRAATDHVFTAPRPLTEADVTPEARARLHALVREHLVAQGKRRFVHKYTGYPRVRYLREVFPDARFVHVVRDGRAVASSLCHVDWWSGEGTWSWGALSAEDRATYVESGCHELVLAALFWKAQMGHLLAARDHAPPDQLLEIRYDALVADREEVMRRVAAFGDLPWDDTFRARIAATPMTSDDTRWRRKLDAEEQALLQRVLGPTLEACGFVP